MSWDVKSADMKYLETMAINEWVSLTQKEKKETINKAVPCFLGFKNKITIDLHVTGLATQLKLFDWLFNNAFQREFYVELRCYTWVIAWLTGKCVALQFNAYLKWALIGFLKFALEN